MNPRPMDIEQFIAKQRAMKRAFKGGTLTSKQRLFHLYQEMKRRV